MSLAALLSQAGTGFRPVFTIGFLVVGAPRFAVAALTSSPAPLIAVMAIEGPACGPIGPITSSITYQLAPEHMRGRAVGRSGR